jgi:hypothetical protein
MKRKLLLPRSLGGVGRGGLVGRASCAGRARLRYQANTCKSPAQLYPIRFPVKGCPNRLAATLQCMIGPFGPPSQYGGDAAVANFCHGRHITWHGTKKKSGRRYRHYLLQRDMQGHAGALGLLRWPTAELESAVLDQLRAILRSPDLLVDILPRAIKLVGFW